MSTRRSKPPLRAERRGGAPAGRKGPARKPQAKGTGSASRKTAARRRPPSRKPPARRGILSLSGALLRWTLRLLWRFAWRLGAVAALIVGIAVGIEAARLPDPSELVDGRVRGSVTMLTRDRQPFAWRGDQFGGPVTADSVSPFLKHAVIATEDKRFYRHLGVSPRGIASAVRINLSEGRGPLSGHGGSTITQQTAKLLCLGKPFDPAAGQSEREYEADCRRTTLWRKAKEAVYAVAMELRYSKDEILGIYLNRAYLGAGARGFEAAAQRYFGHGADAVTPAEAAMLAGLLVAPSTYAPTRDLERSRGRARVVLGLMHAQGYLTDAQYREALDAPARLSPAATQDAGGYFADWIMDEGPAFFTSGTTEDVIIRTTLDARIQAAAEEALTHVFETKVRAGSKAQAAIVVMSPDGAVRAMVGGRQLRVAGAFNRATQAVRQTGSAFKPFVYAAALEMGFSASDPVEDAPLSINVRGSGPYQPRNYDGRFRGMVSLVDALAQSLNTPAVRLSETVGRENVRQVAADFGLESDLALGPALALGASEATLLEMTAAYAGILNGGRAVEPYGLVDLRLAGEADNLIDHYGGMGERVIPVDAAEELVWMMRHVIEQGTGRRAQLPGGHPAAAKTGTTQAARDAWFVGFTADYVAGVWMGYDDNTPLTGVTGGGLPADIWRETMARIHQGVPPRPLPEQPPARSVAFQEGGTVLPPPEGGNVAERVLIDVLRDILVGSDER